MFRAEFCRRQFKRSARVWLVIIIIFIIYYLVNLYSVYYYTYKNKPIIVNESLEILNSIENDLENGVILAMDDPRLIKKISNDFLVPPSEHGPHKTYQLEYPELDPSMGQSAVIKRLLRNKRNGFFIECGALDGETRSNTLHLERFLGWTGLLIEGDPLNFALMVKKNRKAWLSSSCLNKFPFPEKVTFKQRFSLGRIYFRMPGINHSGFVDVQCFPLYSYLLALNISHVDYFSLDVEGDELHVLRTIPFDKVDITILSVEFSHVAEGKEALRKFMESRNYSVVAEVTNPDGFANDFIFQKI